MPWIDAHCHLADSRLSEQLEDILDRSRAAGVNTWIQGGVCPDDWHLQLKLRERFGASIVPAFGVHPWWAAAQAEGKLLDSALVELERILPKAAALGELGLDYGPRHASSSARTRQVLAFETQLALAKKTPKPLILHVVQAHPEALERLRGHAPYARGGLVHSFSASYEIAKAYLDLGFLISLGGAITREGFQTLKKALLHLPLERICLETDSPDQAPRLAGTDPKALNEPANLVGIAEVFASLTKRRRDEVLEQSSRNVRELFQLNGSKHD